MQQVRRPRASQQQQQQQQQQQAPRRQLFQLVCRLCLRSRRRKITRQVHCCFVGPLFDGGIAIQVTRHTSHVSGELLLARGAVAVASMSGIHNATQNEREKKTSTLTPNPLSASSKPVRNELRAEASGLRDVAAAVKVGVREQRCRAQVYATRRKRGFLGC